MSSIIIAWLIVMYIFVVLPARAITRHMNRPRGTPPPFVVVMAPPSAGAGQIPPLAPLPPCSCISVVDPACARCGGQRAIR